jgi:hypothetical protein
LTTAGCINKFDTTSVTPAQITVTPPTQIFTPVPTTIQAKTAPNTAINYSQEEVIAYYEEIGLGFESRNPPEVVYRYSGNQVKIGIEGKPDSESLTCLNTVISDFNAISERTKLSLASDNNYIIQINFTPKSDFPIKCDNPTDEGCFFVVISPTLPGDLQFGLIEISTDNTVDPTFRCHGIREELTQSLGFGKDAGYESPYEDSVFHHHNGPSTTSYSEMDKYLIRLLYNTDVPINATKAEVEDYFAQNPQMMEKVLY